MTVWFNGVFQAKENISLRATFHPWLRGDAIFETIRTFDQTPFFLDRHLNRLSRSAEIVYLPPLPIAEIKDISVAILAKGNISGLGVLRITWFSNGDLLITHVPREMPAPPLRLGIFPHHRDSGFFTNAAKSLSYGPLSAAHRWAELQGFDDALLLNQKGEVVETTSTNVIFDFSGQLKTPVLSSGALPGITREIALEWFPDTQEEVITKAELSLVTGAATMSSIRLVQMVSLIGDREISSSDSLLALSAEFEKRAQANPNY